MKTAVTFKGQQMSAYGNKKTANCQVLKIVLEKVERIMYNLINLG